MKERVLKYLITLVTLLGCIILSSPQVFTDNFIPIGIFICQFLRIIISITAFVVVATNIHYGEGNRISVLAYGYFLISLLILFNIYIYTEGNRMPPIKLNYYTSMGLIQVLEGLFIFTSFVIVNEKQNIKSWFVGISISWLVALWGSFKNNIGYDVSRGNKIIVFCSSCIIVLLVWAWYEGRKEESLKKSKNFSYMTRAIVFKIIYLLSIMVLKIKMSSWLMLLCYIVDTIHYMYIYTYIYQTTIKQFWYKTDACLVHTQSELEKEEIEKHNLVFASYALKKYVQAIDHDATVLKKKMEKSCSKKNLTHIEKINKNCRRLMRLSDNILDLGQMDMGNVTPKYKVTDMNQLINVLVESISPYVENCHLKIEVRESKSPVYCYVDVEEMERALLNLISNAIKYNKKDGQIKVYINERQEQAYICVEDTGIGIPEEKSKKIFERFERVENGFSRAQEGSGLGLAIVKSIVEMHRGSIKVVSKEDWGTLVSISLPIYKGQKNKQMDVRNKVTLQRKIEVELADLKR